MKFTLVYDGPLSSASNNGRVREKHDIRKVVHCQVAHFREIRSQITDIHPVTITSVKQGPFIFQAVVGKKHHATCELDILFLRSGPPGAIFLGGDIDNRMKTLFDALRIPKTDKELPTNAIPDPGAHETPFLCLLEDDSLITTHTVRTDRLLLRGKTDADVRLIIQVSIFPMARTDENLGF
jgi:hypothetical protein